MNVRDRLTLLILFSVAVVSTGAQSLTVGGGIQDSLQRFGGDTSLNRLDGESVGWLILSDVRIGRWIARAEGSHGSRIRNADEITLLVGMRQVTVHSELSHRLWDAALLGGYVKDFTSRFQLTALGGISMATVYREFTTDAAQQILIPPSTVPSAPVTTTRRDRFVSWTIEADGRVSVTSRLGVVGGVRGTPIRLKEGLEGLSVAPFAAVVWRLQ